MKCRFPILISFMLLLILMGSLGAFFAFSSVGAIDERSVSPFLHRSKALTTSMATDGEIWLRSATSIGGPALLRLSWGSGADRDLDLGCTGAHERDQIFVDTEREYHLTRIAFFDESCVGTHTLPDGSQIEVAPRSFFQMSAALSASGVSREGLERVFARRAPPELSSLLGTGGLLAEVIERDERDLEGFISREIGDTSEPRDLRYVSPVLGQSLVIRPDIIPNARRPYRRETTDAIHHGYDIFAPVGTPVVAASRGWVFRTVSGFVWEDFARLKKSPHLTSLERARNLDVYRGNQIWLLTERGDIFIYSHLSSLEPLSVGDRVDVGEVIGRVGDSGVPERPYRFPHLHFEIVPSPLIAPPRKLPSIDTILEWDYFGEGHPQDVVIDLTESLFATGIVVKNGH